jgi:hypothetical protein
MRKAERYRCKEEEMGSKGAKRKRCERGYGKGKYSESVKSFL